MHTTPQHLEHFKSFHICLKLSTSWTFQIVSYMLSQNIGVDSTTNYNNQHWSSLINIAPVLAGEMQILNQWDARHLFWNAMMQRETHVIWRGGSGVTWRRVKLQSCWNLMQDWGCFRCAIKINFDLTWTEVYWGYKPAQAHIFCGNWKRIVYV